MKTTSKLLIDSLIALGTDEIIAFLTRKWQRENSYRLRKEFFALGGHRSEKIAVQFWYEYQDAEDGMRWKRCYGLEHWTFDVSVS